MRRISTGAVKKLVKDSFSISVSDSAADAIAKILEAKAKKIAKYSVKRAKSRKRAMILEEDVETYKMRFGG
ncbi:MAG: NFYB/HAP3 family transcription factor subunit [Candidatus Micrarchaeota archaeon]|nr:NFYB/HAP3 family transcription factor subunit [Candidatus Micrarchaeota archaeon]